MSDDRSVIVHSKRRVFDRFFKIDEADVTFSKIAGAGFIRAKLLVFERGDSAAALLHDVERDCVILTEQFRFPTYDKGPGWLTEPIAGSIEPEETPEHCIRREILEEIGYEAGELEAIGRFYVSPGGTSERVFLFYAPVTQRNLKHAKASGLLQQHENIQRIEVKTAEFIAAALSGRYEDAKLLIAAYWLALKLHNCA